MSIIQRISIIILSFHIFLIFLYSNNVNEIEENKPGYIGEWFIPAEVGFLTSITESTIIFRMIEIVDTSKYNIQREKSKIIIKNKNHEDDILIIEYNKKKDKIIVKFNNGKKLEGIRISKEHYNRLIEESIENFVIINIRNFYTIIDSYIYKEQKNINKEIIEILKNKYKNRNPFAVNHKLFYYGLEIPEWDEDRIGAVYLLYEKNSNSYRLYGYGKNKIINYSKKNLK